MKDKISTFEALDFLNCNLKWINYSIEYIKGHQEALEHFIEKYDIEKDYDTDGEFLIKDYLFKLLIIVNHYWTAKEDNLDTNCVGEGRGELFMNFVNYCLATYA